MAQIDISFTTFMFINTFDWRIVRSRNSFLFWSSQVFCFGKVCSVVFMKMMMTMMLMMCAQVDIGV